jgi:hypothetical protein
VIPIEVEVSFENFLSMMKLLIFDGMDEIGHHLHLHFFPDSQVQIPQHRIHVNE